MSAIVGNDWNVQRGYFNTALRGIPPRASVEAAQQTLELWSRGELDWIKWLDDVERVRSAFAALIGIPPAQIGVGHTTAGLVNVVASNLKPYLGRACGRRSFPGAIHRWIYRGPAHHLTEMPTNGKLALCRCNASRRLASI